MDRGVHPARPGERRGVIAEVRAGSGDDLGAADKRRLVEEPEFARLLAEAGAGEAGDEAKAATG
jgi:hypothetical protein